MHYSVDLETLATTVDAHILTVGVAWWRDGDADVQGSLCITLDDRQEGRRIDPATVRWWLRQGDEARASVSRDPMEGASMAGVIMRLGDLMDDAETVWTMDPSFDAAILNHAADQLDLPRPWPYRHNRCVRTARAAMPDEVVQACWDSEPGAVHSAERDARVQARIAIAYLRGLRDH